MIRILLVALLPIIYVYLRIRKLLADTRYKMGFTVLYIILVLVFPLTEVLSHGGITWGKPLLLFGLYAVPFLLYLFLLLVLLDIGRGVTGWLKLVSPAVWQRRKVRLLTVCFLVLLSMGIVVMGKINLDWMRTKEFNIGVSGYSSPLKQLKIVLAADLHLERMTEKHFLAKFVGKVNELNPDIVLLPGDILEGHDGETEGTDFDVQLRRINAKYGVFAAPGNHDDYDGDNAVAFFEKAGIKVLADRAIIVNNSFYLVGRNDWRSKTRKPLDELLLELSADLPIIMMDHRPFNLQEVAKRKVAIQVSGHTHNGQLFPVNFIVAAIYELSWGYRKIRNTHFFVTSGVQIWGPPVRTTGHSEIVVINVNFTK